MSNLPEIIKQIQRDLACPICGAKYEISQIKVRGAFEQVLIIQTTCSDGHLTVFMTIFNEQDKQNKEVKIAITTNEVLDLSNSLTKFNGDFEGLKLWKQ
jgi:C4-type Zn-finger protein